MGKLPVLSGHEVIKILKKIGFEPARQKGSHIVLVKMTSDSKKL
jgi:predicted RNA binding protein YcfA (HicA-like mRNA interferase family)